MIKKLLIYLPYIILIGMGLYYIVTTVPYVRYWVDDFCSATFLRDNGYFGAQIGWWKTWTGRYSYIAFLDFFELIGPWVIRVLPILLLAGLVLTTIPLFFSNVIFASLFVILTLINAPNIIQSFYWQTGSLNYTIPFIFLNLFLVRLVSKKEKRGVIIPFLFMFVAGGFSESFAVAALVFLIFVLGIVLVINPKDKKEKMKIAVAGIAGITISLIIMLLAPGNAARGLSVTKPESLLFVMKSTILATKWYLLRFLSIKTFLSSLVVILTATYLFSRKFIVRSKKIIYIMLITALASVSVTMAVMGSGYYSMSIIPPERTLFIITSLILYCFFIFSVCLVTLLNNLLNKKFLSKISWIFIILNIVFSSLVGVSVWKDWSKVRTEVKNYAISWDEEVKNLPTIHNIKSVGGLDNFSDNNGWVASCVAGYYDLKGLNIIE